jgi:DNA-binding response OmpR family regulator
MYALVADEDRVTVTLLTASLRRWNLQAVIASDGAAAWEMLNGADPPALAIVDWMMPRLDGVELCRRVRQSPMLSHIYLILLTARRRRADLVEGLEAGADDYLVKPFDAQELRARVNVGIRIVRLQQQLTEQIATLRETLANVKQLKGLLPICSYCKRIRKDEDYWQQLEGYISEHSDAQFSHGICPGCFEQVQVELIRHS